MCTTNLYNKIPLIIMSNYASTFTVYFENYIPHDKIHTTPTYVCFPGNFIFFSFAHKKKVRGRQGNYNKQPCFLRP